MTPDGELKKHSPRILLHVVPLPVRHLKSNLGNQKTGRQSIPGASVPRFGCLGVQYSRYTILLDVVGLHHNLGTIKFDGRA